MFMRVYCNPPSFLLPLLPFIFVSLPCRMALSLSASFLPRLGREKIHTHTHSMYSILQEKLAAMARVQVRTPRHLFYSFCTKVFVLLSLCFGEVFCPFLPFFLAVFVSRACFRCCCCFNLFCSPWCISGVLSFLQFCRFLVVACLKASPIVLRDISLRQRC